MSQRSDASQHLPPGCGDRLRAAREAAGLSIDDVAARLRMPARVVRSLEAEDWSRLGAPVFVRGQVRSYARLLGLTTAPMMQALDVGPVEPTRLVSRVHTPKWQWWAEQLGRRLIYIVLTLSLAIPAWIATRQHLAAPGGGSAPLDVPLGAADAPAGAAPVPPAAGRTVVASMAPVVLPAPRAAIELQLRAPSWVEAVAADGSVVERGVLPAGSERRYAPGQLARLTIGNASAAVLRNRGEDVDVQAHARANVARFAVSSDGTLAASD
ncbi:helix-turn-helix domain-containing protein [Thermomonas flagellata]|uniref:helix-turn-helix domain-containing protein n=1 Tax=Thermomonas flagellata TaxID=2888524 RepID=UPI001F03D75F|nr:helix-turn-helix domain-containing protein [Thermomonas flagellata]